VALGECNWRGRRACCVRSLLVSAMVDAAPALRVLRDAASRPVSGAWRAYLATAEQFASGGSHATCRAGAAVLAAIDANGGNDNDDDGNDGLAAHRRRRPPGWAAAAVTNQRHPPPFVPPPFPPRASADDVASSTVVLAKRQAGGRGAGGGLPSSRTAMTARQRSWLTFARVRITTDDRCDGVGAYASYSGKLVRLRPRPAIHPDHSHVQIWPTGPGPDCLGRVCLHALQYDCDGTVETPSSMRDAREKRQVRVPCDGCGAGDTQCRQTCCPLLIGNVASPSLPHRAVASP
jgi:hypothetical protein